jgi:hypothetical protein
MDQEVMLVHTDWLLTVERVAVHRPTATGVLADLHLGYDRARCRRGDAVPLTALDDLLAALAAVRARDGIQRVVIAGDLFEDATGQAMIPDLLRWLDRSGLELSGVVPGNHDRELHGTGLPLCPEGVQLGEWLVVHGDGPLPQGRAVLGHFHPCLRWDRTLAGACYLVGETSLVLPAFSVDAAGVNVLGARRWQQHRCVVICEDRLLDFGELSRLGRPRRRTPR